MPREDVMSGLNLIKEFLEKAVIAEDPRLSAEKACEVLAQTLIDDEEIDQEALERLTIEFAKRLNARDDFLSLEVLLAQLRVSANCLDYREHHQVALSSGWVATKNGWNSDNVEPGNLEGPPARYHKVSEG